MEDARIREDSNEEKEGDEKDAKKRVRREAEF